MPGITASADMPVEAASVAEGIHNAAADAASLSIRFGQELKNVLTSEVV
jgi:hypothetical protein